MRANKFFIQTLAVLLFLAVSAKGQISKTDSLRKLITTETNEQRRTDLLLLLSIEFRQINPDSSNNISEQLMKLSAQQKNIPLHQKAEINKVYYYLNKSNADSGLSVSEKNIRSLLKSKGNDSLLAQYFSAAGLSLMRLNRQKDAMEKFFNALKTSEQAGDKLMMAKAQHNIGWAYMELNQYTEAITHFTSALQIIEKNKIPFKMAVSYANIASCYGALNKYDSVYKYAGEGIKMAHEQNNYQTEANGWYIMGTAYTNEKKYEQALACFLKAKPIRAKIGDPFFIVSDLAVLSELYAMMNKTAEGLQTGNEALTIAKKENLQSKLPMIYKAIALNYEKSGNYAAAAELYKQVNVLKDSMYENASAEAVVEMKTKYETEKKERIIQEQQFNLKKKNYFIITISALVLLGALLAWLFYNRTKLKQETKLQAAVLSQQQIAAAAILQAEENERQRIAKDLHDGVGQIMSAAKMNLSSFENDLQFKDEEQKLSFERIISLVDEGCKEVRSVSHQMMPNVLLKSGLGKAVAEFLDKIDQKVLKVNLHTEGLNEHIEATTEIVLYRVLQESVNNVIKHSGASELDLSLIKDADGISATIEDNGKGFDSKNLSEKAGLGLKNMKARVEYLKGTIDFDSSPGRGTLVAIHIPLINKEAVES
ncbi:MAG: sensor histidine kinase [Chitinophagaceae bacterium]|nr:sensor histidine kinase [Chitinophagaceae bacterium]